MHYYALEPTNHHGIWTLGTVDVGGEPYLITVSGIDKVASGRPE